jgi:hypothetical protein
LSKLWTQKADNSTVGNTLSSDGNRLSLREAVLMKNKAVKVAMFKMKIKDINKVISISDMYSWDPYPGDFSSDYSDQINGEAVDAMSGIPYRTKGMVICSAN